MMDAEVGLVVWIAGFVGWADWFSGFGGELMQ